MNEVKQARNRARRYWQIDGINELVVGAAVAWIGTVFVLAGYLDSSSLRYVGIANMFVLGILMPRILRLMKDRITSPRTGHVSYPGQKAPLGHRVLMTCLGIGMMFELQYGDLRNLTVLGEPIEHVLFYALFFTPIAVACAVRGIQWQMPRLLFIAASVLIAGLISWFGQPSDAITLALWLLLPGATAAMTGTWGLICYLKENPLQLEEGDHVS